MFNAFALAEIIMPIMQCFDIVIRWTKDKSARLLKVVNRFCFWRNCAQSF